MIGSEQASAPVRVRKIGLMGGSFDPVHQAHVALAHAALDQLGLDELRWIPVGQAWQKNRRMASPEHRMAMVALAIQHEPRFVLDPIEIHRMGPSYTLDTVRAMQMAQSTHDESVPIQWFLIIGQDQYANFHTWHGWRELVQRVILAVANRPGSWPPAGPDLAACPHQVVSLPMPMMPVSSSQIRAQLAQGSDPQTLAPAMVSNTVARYIAHHQLYAPGTLR